MLSVEGKLYGRVLIKRAWAGTEHAIWEEQCGFSRIEDAWMMTDQLFVVRQVCEKYLANGKGVFWAVVDLEKAYDTIHRHGMWRMLRIRMYEDKKKNQPTNKKHVYLKNKRFEHIKSSSSVLFLEI